MLLELQITLPLKKITARKCTINFLMYLLNPSEGKHLLKYFVY
jgi:hypothetical protein